MKKNKMRLTLRVMAPSSLTWRLKSSFKKHCNEIDSIGTMMDKVMVNKCTLPFLLWAIFFIRQNVNHFEIILPNHGTQHETKQQNSPTTK